METLFLRIPILVGIVSIVAAASPGSVAGGDNSHAATEHQAGQRAELQQRLQELDSPSYDTRRRAVQRLESWLGMPEMTAMLAEQFQQLMVQPELPFEVRWRISIWRTRLPLVKCEPPPSVSTEELERLVRQLDDDSYCVRAGASERLRWLAASEHLAQPIILILKRRLTDPSLGEELLSPHGIDP